MKRDLYIKNNKRLFNFFLILCDRQKKRLVRTNIN